MWETVDCLEEERHTAQNTGARHKCWLRGAEWGVRDPSIACRQNMSLQKDKTV